MRIRNALVLVGTTFLLAAATSADAQGTTPIDISAGYQFSRFNGSGETDGTSVPQGWTASVTGHFHPALNLVGEVNGAYKDDRECQVIWAVFALAEAESTTKGFRVAAGLVFDITR